jgi:hypothetical protein
VESRRPRRLRGLPTRRWSPRTGLTQQQSWSHAARCERRRSHRPCHPRATSSGHERYAAVNHGHSKQAVGLGSGALTWGRGGGRNCMACKGSGVQIPSAPPPADHRLRRRGGMSVWSAEVCPCSAYVRIGCMVVVGRWLGLGLVRPDIRQGTHEVVGGALHWPWCQKFDGSELPKSAPSSSSRLAT